MQQNWQYQNPVKVIHALGARAQLGSLLPFERMALVTTPGFTRRGVTEQVREALGPRLVAVLDDVKPNPDLLDIDRQAQSLRSARPDALIALGGGSSIDTAKALARVLSQPAGFSLAAHFREGRQASNSRALPVVALPTTAGTGAEVTPFGTVWDFEKGKKYSVVGDDLYPAVAVLDPELTMGLPEDVTISSGLDAVSHALESAWNRNANPITLGFSAKSLQLSLQALPRLATGEENVVTRGMMMQASLLAGLAISQTRTALAHSMSYPLTTAFDLPHGLACSFTLPALLRFNAEADDGRLLDLARTAGEADLAGFEARLYALFAGLEVSKQVSRHIPDASQMLRHVDVMFTPGRADNNLRAAGSADVRALLEAAIHDLDTGYSQQGEPA